ncbi:MAG: hypothetical protein LBT40_10775 [Deltaproteobacteria bacterium]|nr:hypothetical protein [Deltaproteobacteria bacterium]
MPVARAWGGTWRPGTRRAGRSREPDPEGREEPEAGGTGNREPDPEAGGTGNREPDPEAGGTGSRFRKDGGKPGAESGGPGSLAADAAPGPEGNGGIKQAEVRAPQGA